MPGMFIFHSLGTPYSRQPLCTRRSEILSGLVWVSIKIIIAGRGAFLSSMENRFGSGPAATARLLPPIHTTAFCFRLLQRDRVGLALAVR